MLWDVHFQAKYTDLTAFLKLSRSCSSRDFLNSFHRPLTEIIRAVTEQTLGFYRLCGRGTYSPGVSCLLITWLPSRQCTCFLFSEAILLLMQSTVQRLVWVLGTHLFWYCSADRKSGGGRGGFTLTGLSLSHFYFWIICTQVPAGILWEAESLQPECVIFVKGRTGMRG